MRIFRKVDDPEVGYEANDFEIVSGYYPRANLELTDRDHSLHKKHPPPSSKASSAIQVIKSKVQEASQANNGNLTRLQESEAELLFFPRVPSTDEITAKILVSVSKTKIDNQSLT